MLAISKITLAYIIGILWGLYLELNSLIITSIFLCFVWLMFIKRNNLAFIILVMVCLLGSWQGVARVKEFDEKYIEGTELKINITIISQLSEKKYTYMYNCKSENGDKFIVYFKKSDISKFKIGDSLNIIGEFNLPDVARNRGRF